MQISQTPNHPLNYNANKFWEGPNSPPNAYNSRASLLFSESRELHCIVALIRVAKRETMPRVLLRISIVHPYPSRLELRFFRQGFRVLLIVVQKNSFFAPNCPLNLAHKPSTSQSEQKLCVASDFMLKIQPNQHVP